MPKTIMTDFPRSTAAQKKFDKCKKGDTVWFTGGFTIAGDWQSFGRRAQVVEIKTGVKGGVIVKPDNDPKQRYCLACLITKANILESLKSCPSEEEKEAYLKHYQLKAGDLEGQAEAPKNSESPSLKSMTKAQLIERVQQLEAELAARNWPR